MLRENQFLEEEERGTEGCEEKKEENIKTSENRNKNVRTRREPATRGRGGEGGEEENICIFYFRFPL